MPDEQLHQHRRVARAHRAERALHDQHLATGDHPVEVDRSESLSSTRLIDGELSSRASLFTGASSFAVVVLRASASCAVQLGGEELR